MEQEIQRLKRLVEFCGDPFDGISADGRLGFEWGMQGRDKARLTIDVDKLSLTVSSWMESYHNGDSYDERTEILSQEDAEKALNKLLIRCEARAMEKAKKQVLEEQARQRLDHFLKAKTVLDS